MRSLEEDIEREVRVGLAEEVVMEGFLGSGDESEESEEEREADLKRGAGRSNEEEEAEAFLEEEPRVDEGPAILAREVSIRRRAGVMTPRWCGCWLGGC